MVGKLSFEDAITDARERGAGDYNAKLRDFRNWIAESQLDAEFRKVSKKERGGLKFELKSIERRVQKLLSILQGGPALGHSSNIPE
jgi:hypothetical protein